MTEQATQTVADDWRDRILGDPGMILDDRDVMRALMAANGQRMGGNVVDMRGVAMERLETRLDRLEDTHRSVVAAAYENLSGTNQINRCVLRLLDCEGFEDILALVDAEMRDILQVERIRLVLESAAPSEAPHPAVAMVAAGFVADYVAPKGGLAARTVTLRRCTQGAEAVFGADAGRIGSEALLMLDLGDARLAGMLAFGAADAEQFRASQGTELLTFFTGTFERVLRRHLG